MDLPLSRAAWLRIVPFVVFMLLLVLRGSLDGDGRFDARWLYALNVVVVGALLWAFRADYGELARANAPTASEAGLAALVGVVVFVAWINLDAPALRIGDAAASFTPVDADGGLNWPLVAVRWLGATLLVPVMEELFWRSFLMRWIDRAQFETLVPQQASTKAIVLSTFVFMLAHTLWLAAIVAGLAYAWLFVRTGKLWVPVIAHAVTNGVLGAWVVATGRWSFW